MSSPALSKVLLTVTALLMPVTSVLVPMDSFQSGPGEAVTPPGIFFAIWGLVIIGCWAVALLGWVRSASRIVDTVAWPLVIAQAGFSVWLVFAYLRTTHPTVGSICTVLTFVVILASLLVAIARLRTAEGQSLWLIAGTAALFAGWSSAAIWLNVITVLPDALANSTVVQTIGVAGAAITTLAVTVTLRPAWAYSGAVIWALIGIAISASRFGAWPPFVVAVAGIVIVGFVGVRSRRAVRHSVGDNSLRLRRSR